jgi:hypothetical protein
VVHAHAATWVVAFGLTEVHGMILPFLRCLRVGDHVNALNNTYLVMAGGNKYEIFIVADKQYGSW